MHILAFTGHRPKDLGDYTQEDLYRELNELLPDRLDRNFEPVEWAFVTGGALGIDTWAAEYALDHGIPLHIILPFTVEVMTKLWPERDRERLQTHLDMADEWDVVGIHGYDPAMYQRRNEAMVDLSNGVLAFWNGKKSGGTYNCIRYALTTGRTIVQMLNRPPLRNPSRITTI